MDHSPVTVRAFAAPARPGAILLETVLSVALFVTGVSLVGASVQASLRSSRRIADSGQAVAFAQSMLARIRAGEFKAENDAEGDFGPHFPRFHYRLEIDDAVDLPNVRYVTVTVGWGEPGATIDDDETSNQVSLTGWVYGLVPPAEEEDTGVEPGDSAEPADTGGVQAPTGGGTTDSGRGGATGGRSGGTTGGRGG